MEDWTDEFDHGMSFDGFWELYRMTADGWLRVFTMHDDDVPSGMDDDERLLFLIRVYDIHMEEAV